MLSSTPPHTRRANTAIAAPPVAVSKPVPDMQTQDSQVALGAVRSQPSVNETLPQLRGQPIVILCCSDQRSWGNPLPAHRQMFGPQTALLHNWCYGAILGREGSME